MKSFILVLLFSPLCLFAQNRDPRIMQRTPADGVKSVSIKLVRNELRDKRELDENFQENVLISRRDTLWSDTVIYETKYYGRNGRIDSADYEYRNPIHSTYSYTSDTEWVCLRQSKYRTDTILVTGNKAMMSRLDSGSVETTVYSGDSVHCEHRNSSGKVIFKYDYCSGAADSFWDYVSAGPYRRKEVVHANAMDTVRYYGKNGKWLVMVINYFDSAGHTVKSDYYNRGVKKFDMITIAIPKYNTSIYLPDNGSRVSMTIIRKYDEYGMLTEEEYFVPGNETALAIRYYEYDFYHAR